jgi:hypothetical protein
MSAIRGLGVGTVGHLSLDLDDYVLVLVSHNDESGTYFSSRTSANVCHNLWNDQRVGRIRGASADLSRRRPLMRAPRFLEPGRESARARICAPRVPPSCTLQDYGFRCSQGQGSNLLFWFGFMVRTAGLEPAQEFPPEGF